MSFATFATGVLAFECCFSNLTSAAVYGLRVGLVFFALANLFSSNRDGTSYHLWSRHQAIGTIFRPIRSEAFPGGFRDVASPSAPIGRDLAAPIDDFLMMTSAKIKAWVAEVKEDASPMSWF
jgi:hypothetical protein